MDTLPTIYVEIESSSKIKYRSIFKESLTVYNMCEKFSLSQIKRAEEVSYNLVGYFRYSLDVSGISCALDWRNVDDKYVLYILAVSFLAYVLPYAVIVVCLTKARDSQTVERSFSCKKKAVLPNGLKEAQLRNVCYSSK